MVGRLLFLFALLASLIAPPAGMQKDQGKELIETRSAEPQGQSLYTSSHALVIGVNTYPNLPKNLQLQFAAADATAVRDMLVKTYGFPPDEVVTLTNEKATLANIRQELSRLASSRRVKADDRIVVYFSGHGQTVKLPTGGEMGFLIPTDAKIDMSVPDDAGPYLETCLPMKQVWDYLSSSPAKHACVIADACFSGMMASSRSLSMSHDTVNAMLARPARQVLTAGGVGQKTFERPDLGHGVFTYKLLEEMKARAADPGKVFSLMDLYTSLSTSVSNLTEGKQIPKFGSVDTEGQVLFCAGSVLMANTNPTNPTGGPPPTTTPGGTTPPVNTRAKLTITCNQKASLTIDGVKKGSTPYTMELDLKSVPDQTVQIHLEAKGFITAETTATLKPGDDLTLPIDLKPIPPKPPAITTADIAIDSNPQGAKVKVDGNEVGVTPYALHVDLKNKKEQKLKIRVEMQGYFPAESTATVQPGSTISVPFELKLIPEVKPPEPPKQPKRNVKQLALSQTATLPGSTSVSTVTFSPDGKRVAVSGLDYSLSIYDAKGGAGKKVEAPKGTIVRITPDWKTLLFIRLLTDGQNTWASVTPRDMKTNSDGTAMRINLRPGASLADAYAGNGRLILCGSYGTGDSSNGFCSVADFAKGEASSFTGGYRMSGASSSGDDGTYAVYMEPLDVRAAGNVVIIPADLTQKPHMISTADCNTSGGIELSDDGSRVAVTCLRAVQGGGVEVQGTRVFDTASGQELQFLPKLRASALMAKGTRVLGWRPQIGGSIVELLDAASGNGLGETPGSQIWLSPDEKLAAQASPEGAVTIYKLTQP